jgi:hypothetical protein
MRALDMAGKRFGKTVAIRPGPKDGRGTWVCLCDCGKEHYTRAAHLVKGKAKSCGCLPHGRHIELLYGRRFGLWEVSASVDFRHRKTSKAKFPEIEWFCHCECGVERWVLSGSLLRKSAPSLSCGCLYAEALRLRPYEALFNGFVAKCNKQNTITYRQFVNLFTTQDKCHYCWEPLTWTKHNIGKNGCKYQLDRKNNAFGYSVKNCVVCCTQCNMRKSHRFTYEEWWKSTQWRRDEIAALQSSPTHL